MDLWIVLDDRPAILRSQPRKRTDVNEYRQCFQHPMPYMSEGG